MPLYDLECPACQSHVRDKYFHRPLTPDTMPVCASCGHRMAVDITGAPVPLTKTYAEGREYVDLHIRPDGKPQIITSWGQRRRLMKEFNLEDPGVKRGMPGSWA